jgi:hypothetical protein
MHNKYLIIVVVLVLDFKGFFDLIGVIKLFHDFIEVWAQERLIITLFNFEFWRTFRNELKVLKLLLFVNELELFGVILELAHNGSHVLHDGYEIFRRTCFFFCWLRWRLQTVKKLLHY